MRDRNDSNTTAKGTETFMRTKRYDLAKGIGILLVVMGHLEYISEPLRYFIVSFHMPLFFVISGMLMLEASEEKKEPRAFVGKKLSRMGIPYLLYSIAFLIIEVLYGYMTGTFEKWTFIQDIWLGISLYGISVLWFLPAMFFGMLWFYLVRRRFSHRVTLIILCIMPVMSYGFTFVLEAYKAATVYNFILSELYYVMAMALRSVFACFYLGAGYYFCYLLKKKKYTEIKPFPATLISAVLLALVAYLSQVNGPVDLHFLIFGNPLIYLFDSMAGSLAVILISFALERIADTLFCRVLIYYGINSLTVMATHINFYILYGSIIFVMHLMKYIEHAKGYLFCPLIVVTVFAVEAAVIEGIEVLKKIVTKRA